MRSIWCNRPVAATRQRRWGCLAWAVTIATFLLQLVPNMAGTAPLLTIVGYIVLGALSTRRLAPGIQAMELVSRLYGIEVQPADKR